MSRNTSEGTGGGPLITVAIEGEEGHHDDPALQTLGDGRAEGRPVQALQESAVQTVFTDGTFSYSVADTLRNRAQALVYRRCFVSLHSVGLLHGSFRPEGTICVVRSLWRHREGLIQMAAQHVLHMQKSLDQMNLQLHHVLSEITGLSGLRILDAILAGERNPVKLAELCHWRVKRSRDTVAKALEGDYRTEHLFALKQSLAGYLC